MDTTTPPPADSVVAADVYWGWLAALTEEERAIADALKLKGQAHDQS